MSLGTQRRLALALLAAVAALALGWLGWFAARSPHSRFLPPDRGGAWIDYPTPPNILGSAVLTRYEQHATFRRGFDLGVAPAWARLRVRGFTDCSVLVNGRPVALPEGAPWSRLRTADVAELLRAGPNEVRAVVANDSGPPALWLSLEGPGWSIASDGAWRVALDGATECPARLAGQVPELRPGNGAAGGNGTLPSVRARWPALLLFAALATAILFGVRAAWKRWPSPRLFGRELSPLALGLIAASALWVLLFAENTCRAPLYPCGFDATYHLEYVQYVEEHGALPLADEGWEMHQPPLFYGVAAGLLRLAGLSTQDAGALVVLRLLGLAAGLAQLALVAGCMALVFPGQPRRQLAGLALAAFLPAQIYTCHYVTNEFLLTLLGTAALYLTLRLLRDDRPPLSRYALLGLGLGAALLTKVTALVVVGVVLLVLTGQLVVRRGPHPAARLRGLAVAVLLALLVAGWHYARVAAHFGTPLVGNYDVRSGFWWWQGPGYATVAYLIGFGRCLVAPFFSAFYGLPDGLYSTFWGDGMCGGVGAWSHRPPWNYDLMAAGYLLALVPSVFILIGLAAALVRLVRQPRAEWFLLLGVLGGLAVGLLYQFLRYPYYGHGRASYLLTGMVPVCALAALGFDALARLGRVPAALAVILLGTWAGAAYASFWIPAHAAATENWAGDQELRAQHFGLAEAYFRRAAAADPRAALPRLNRARALLAEGRRPEARQSIEAVLRDEPDNPDAHLLLGFVCQDERKPGEAAEELRRAGELAPDHPLVYPALGAVLLEQHRDEEAIVAYREALRISPSEATAHANLGLLLARAGRTEEAVVQYRCALALHPDAPEWRADLARIQTAGEGGGSRARPPLRDKPYVLPGAGE
ncbi:MAG TPA: tetratricopeptide repeat protein [Gemmataceae bacterium]|nr:tetratricopeptide repeat protein [Gemmataceae bacterium]